MTEEITLKVSFKIPLSKDCLKLKKFGYDKDGVLTCKVVDISSISLEDIYWGLMDDSYFIDTSSIRDKYLRDIELEHTPIEVSLSGTYDPDTFYPLVVDPSPHKAG